MKSKDATPLGYVQLTSGAMPIFPMHDILLNYTFENPDHWDDLKQEVNLIIRAYTQTAYKQYKLKTNLLPIEGSVMVRTQYQYFLSRDGKTTRKQDIEITDETTALKYVEFQNRADVSIGTRSTEYFGLSIGHSKGKPVEQIWLLAEDIDSLLDGNTFSRHILQDEATGKKHPGNAGILYVSLTRLSKEESPAGELALFLLGKLKSPNDKTVKKIAETFNISFTAFKENKEVAEMLSLKERGWQEGRQEGRQEGVIDSIKKFADLIAKGYSPEDAMRIISEEEGILESL
ncbi:MAG: hypothetical protein FWC77_00330 [Defluviitaleaceae bacterium]|nr:hypothetical protein [Defluviitaleaceae bacterium]